VLRRGGQRPASQVENFSLQLVGANNLEESSLMRLCPDPQNNCALPLAGKGWNVLLRGRWEPSSGTQGAWSRVEALWIVNPGPLELVTQVICRENFNSFVKLFTDHKVTITTIPSPVRWFLWCNPFFLRMFSSVVAILTLVYSKVVANTTRRYLTMVRSTLPSLWLMKGKNMNAFEIMRAPDSTGKRLHQCNVSELYF
jgi:hypothetical protein